MRTREQLIHLRIIHVVIIIATAFFAYQFSNWGDALWIPISALAVIGPFTPGMSINKARQRIVGSLAGLLLSVLVWCFLQIFPNAVVILPVILMYFLAFCLLQEYTYFIMIVSLMLCINFDYMNLFINNEVVYLTNRIMCVFTGVMICQFYEYFVFRRYYDNALALVEKERLDQLIISSWESLNKYSSNNESIDISLFDEWINSVVTELNRLEELKGSFLHTYSDQTETLTLLNNYIEKLRAVYSVMSSKAYGNLVRTCLELNC